MKTAHRFPVADFILTIVMLIVFGGAWLIAGGWPHRASLFPRIVTGVSFILSVITLINLLVRSRRPEPTAPPTQPTQVRPGADPGEETDSPDNSDLEYVFGNAGKRAWSGALAWVVFFFLSLYILGLFVTAPLFAALYLKFAAKASWLVILLYSGILAIIFYGGFGVLLGQPVPTGRLWSILSLS